MHAPEFWRTDAPPARLLDPLGRLYGRAVAWRLCHGRPLRAPVPVICVGNLTLGGSGKTPTALALAARLLARGRRPHFLTRGYGGALRGPVRVDPATHSAREVGDEALLLAAVAPTWVARDRAAGALAAADAGAGVLVMDDGFQNPGLAQDLALIVIDGESGLGNGRIFPAGPLREAPAAGFARASAVVVIGDDVSGIGRRLPAGLPVLGADLRPGPDAPPLRGARVVAFAGIGRPEKLFRALADEGAEVVLAKAFPDHHMYESDELEPLLRAAERTGARLITTAKDRPRLPAGLRSRIAVLPITLIWRDFERLDRLLEPALH